MLQQLEFKRHKVQQVLRTVLEERMKGQMYDPVKGAQVRLPCFSGGALLCICWQVQLRIALPAQVQPSNQSYQRMKLYFGLEHGGRLQCCRTQRLSCAATCLHLDSL